MNESYIIGTCLQMCPQGEIRMREKEKLLHVLEMQSGTEKSRHPKADKNKVVKAFSRSAAGQNMQHSRDLRPPNVLLCTINYLLKDVVNVNFLPWHTVYEFVMDRLRAVRQDMVVQNLSVTHSINILEPIIRFHAYSSYRLCEENKANFDPYINKQHFLECLKRLLVCYDCLEISKFKNGGDKDKSLHNLIEYSKNRPFFEALYLLLNLGDTIAMTRALNLHKKWKTELVQKALKLSLEYWKGNYVRVCRLISQLPSLLGAVAGLHLPSIRRTMFCVMSTAYSSKNLQFPSKILEEWLLYSNKNDVMLDVKYYGILIENDSIKFIKGHFDNHKETISPRHEMFIDKKIEDTDLSSLMLNGDVIL